MEAMEKIGSGTWRIRDLCQEYGVAEPVIEVSDRRITTTFPCPAAQIRPESVPG